MPATAGPKPGRSASPAVSCLDHAQHGELGPVQVAEDGQQREATCGGLVRRR
jgi:hypothetical protein